MRISRRMGLTVSGLAFAGSTVFMLGAAESASAQTATVAPQRSSVTSYSLVGHGWHGRGHWRTYLRSGSYTSYSFSYYKRTTWQWCGCCC
ncbi:MAG: hypothetical protein ACJ72W_10270 [Actinoallomurus sp.]